MIDIIDSTSAIAAAVREFRKTIIESSAETRPAQMGHQGGLIETDVHWLPQHDIWAAFRDRENRYWNAFGIGTPFDEQSLSMIVQVNPPKQGIDRRTGGAFGRDEEGTMYVLHRGRVGGGRKGIGKDAFLSFFAGSGPIRLAGDGEEESPVIVIGTLDDVAFISALSAFVHQVARFKRLATGIGLPEEQHLASEPELTFSPEYVGQKEVSGRDSIVAECRHGIVVNELQRRLEARGYTAVNDQLRDVYVIDYSHEMTVLFEVKPSSSRQSLYTAIGQLTLNAPVTNCTRVAVVPDDLQPDLQQRLEKRDIRTMTFEWQENTPVFRGLAEVLP